MDENKNNYIIPKGKEQLKEIIIKLIDNDISFDFINNVLSFKNLKNQNIKGLWFWFGNLRIAKYSDTNAGEMEILDTFEFIESENNIKFKFNGIKD